VGDFLRIEGRLPRPAALELSARLLAARPDWDVETEDGLALAIPLIPGAVDSELTVVEESCARLEATRPGLEIDLKVSRAAEPPDPGPGPAGAGPFRILQAEEAAAGAAVNDLVLPPGFLASRRWWAGATLLLAALADHLAPHPGAEETRGLPALFIESRLPLAAQAASLAGAQPVDIGAPGGSLKRDRAGFYGLIALHLSPYLASKKLKNLASGLRPGGVILLSGLANGPQTAHLLRAAARAGLWLTWSAAEGDWGVLKLTQAPVRGHLPPLTGSLVPDLIELPEELAEDPAEELPDDSLRPEDIGEEEDSDDRDDDI
jgi:hypothetical protein